VAALAAPLPLPHAHLALALDSGALSAVGGGAGAVTRAEHEAAARALCDRYTRAVTGAMQATLTARLRTVAAAEAAPVAEAKRRVQELLRYYHNNEAGIAEACQQLREADVVLAYLREENAGLRRVRDKHRARIAATAKANAAAAAAAAAADAAAAAEEAAAFEETRNATRRNYNCNNNSTSDNTAGNGGDDDGDNDDDVGMSDTLASSLSSNPIDAALSARLNNRNDSNGKPGLAASGHPRNGGANGGTTSSDGIRGATVAQLRSEAAQLKAALARKVAQHKERRMLVAQRRQELAETKLAVENAKVEARAQLRESLEAIADRARDTQLAREERRREVAAARGAERELKQRRAALTEQLLDMGALETKLRGMEATKQAEAKELAARRLRLRQVAEHSLRATEDAYIAACRARADTVEAALKAFARVSEALRRATACAVCAKPMTEPCVVVETGEGCCRACAPKYSKRDALQRLRDDARALAALGVVLPQGPPPEEPWVELYLRQDPPASIVNSSNNEADGGEQWVPYVPELQRDPVTGEFQTRFALYDAQLQDMMMHCQLTPVILRSFLAQRTRKPAAQAAAQIAGNGGDE